MSRQFSCGQCGLSITADEEGEVVRLAKNHAENAHGMSMSHDDIQEGMSEASADD